MQYSTQDGHQILSTHQDLDVRLMQGGRAGMVSFIGACIEFGWNSKEAILAKVQQITGPYDTQEVSELLRIHSSPIARPQLWTRNVAGNFELIRGGWKTGEPRS